LLRALRVFEAALRRYPGTHAGGAGAGGIVSSTPMSNTLRIGGPGGGASGGSGGEGGPIDAATTTPTGAFNGEPGHFIESLADPTSLF